MSYDAVIAIHIPEHGRLDEFDLKRHFNRHSRGICCRYRRACSLCCRSIDCAVAIITVCVAGDEW